MTFNRLHDARIQHFPVAEQHLHISALFHSLLPQVGIAAGFPNRRIAQIQTLEFIIVSEAVAYHPLKELVVELHDIAHRTEIAFKLYLFGIACQHASMQTALDMWQHHELPYIPLPEPVDGLFAVAHHQRLGTHLSGVGREGVRHRLVDEGQHVTPLQAARILEFVNHIVVVPAADSLVDEWSRLIHHLFRNTFVEFRDVHPLLVFVVLVLDAIQASQQGQPIDVVQQQLSAVV